MKEGVLDDAREEAFRAEFKTLIDQGLKAAAQPHQADTSEIDDRFAPEHPRTARSTRWRRRELRFIDAITEGLRTSMEKHPASC